MLSKDLGHKKCLILVYWSMMFLIFRSVYFGNISKICEKHFQEEEIDKFYNLHQFCFRFETSKYLMIYFFVVWVKLVFIVFRLVFKAIYLKIKNKKDLLEVLFSYNYYYIMCFLKLLISILIYFFCIQCVFWMNLVVSLDF